MGRKSLKSLNVLPGTEGASLCPWRQPEVSPPLRPGCRRLISVIRARCSAGSMRASWQVFGVFRAPEVEGAMAARGVATRALIAVSGVLWACQRPASGDTPALSRAALVTGQVPGSEQATPIRVPGPIVPRVNPRGQRRTSPPSLQQGRNSCTFEQLGRGSTLRRAFVPSGLDICELVLPSRRRGRRV